MADSWAAYMAIGNGWGGKITDVTMKHSVKPPGKGDPVVTVITVPSLEVGQISESKGFLTYEDEGDYWSVQFKDASGTMHSVEDKQADIKVSDTAGIVFVQVTSENNRLTLYFPVSSNVHTDI